MTKNNFLSVVSFIFLIVGIVHAMRLFNGWEVQIGDLMLPVWVSWIGVVVAFYLSYSGFRLLKKA